MKKSARRTQKNEEVAEIHHAPDLILGDNNEEDEDYITYYRAGDEEGVLRSVILTYNIIFHIFEALSQACSPLEADSIDN